MKPPIKIILIAALHISIFPINCEPIWGQLADFGKEALADIGTDVIKNLGNSNGKDTLDTENGKDENQHSETSNVGENPIFGTLLNYGKDRLVDYLDPNSDSDGKNNDLPDFYDIASNLSQQVVQQVIPNVIPNDYITKIESAVALINDVNEIISILGYDDAYFANSTNDECSQTIKSLRAVVEDLAHSPWFSRSSNHKSIVSDFKDLIQSDYFKDSMNHLSIPLEKLKNKMTYSENYFLPLLLTLQKAQQTSKQESEVQDNTPLNSRISTSGSLDLNSVRRFANVSTQVYVLLQNSSQEIAASLGIGEHDVLKTMTNHEYVGKVHFPGFMIYLDHKEKAVVIAIRGTQSIKDAIMDAVGDLVPFLDGWAHRDMLQGAQKIIKESMGVLKKAFDRFPNYKFVLTGHSLGGGTAELITLDMLYGQNGKKLGLGRRNTKISCVTIGAPPVFSSNHTMVPIEPPEIISIVNKLDVVPTASIGTVGILLEQISDLDSLEFTVAEKSRMLFEYVYRVLERKFCNVTDVIDQFTEILGELGIEEIGSLGSIFENTLGYLTEQITPGTIQLLKKSANAISNFLKSLTGCSLINGPLSNKTIEMYEGDRSYNEKVSEAIKVIKKWRNRSDLRFLEHPGKVYKIHDGLEDKEGSCEKKPFIQKLSAEQKKSSVRNIHLDIVQMALDHLGASYMNAINAIVAPIL